MPPYIDPIIEDEIIKGRGSCDAKGQIACQIFAIEELLSKLPELANKLAVLYVVGEEVDHIGMLEANKLFLNPEFLICGEPTELKLAKRQKGILKLKLTSKGKSAHSGYPQKGHNALEPLLDVLQDLKSEKWLENNILGKTTMNIGVIKAGEASNVVPGYAEALISFRLVTEPEIILEKVEEIIKGRVLIEKLTSNSPLSLEVLDGMDRDIVAFNTDIAYFNGFKNGSCKALLFGVGSITDAHSDWEFVRKEDLKECVKSYKKIILELVSKLK